MEKKPEITKSICIGVHRLALWSIF